MMSATCPPNTLQSLVGDANHEQKIDLLVSRERLPHRKQCLVTGLGIELLGLVTDSWPVSSGARSESLTVLTYLKDEDHHVTLI